MGSGDIGIILVAAIVVGGGIWLMSNKDAMANLKGLFNQEDETVPPPTTETTEAAEPAEEPAPAAEPAYEEEPPQPEVQYVPYPVTIPSYVPGLTRRQICSRYYGGSCSSECRDNYGSRLCRECISYCGPPPPRMEPRREYYQYTPPRPRPRGCPPKHKWSPSQGKCVKEYGGPGPGPREECPRGQRYNWQKKKCETVPKEPKPKPPETPAPTPQPQPDTPMSTSPNAGTPESTGQPSNARYAYAGW